MLALKNTDERLRADKSVSVGFVLAAVLWPTLNAMWQRNQSHGQKPVPALMDAMNTMRDTVEKGWAYRKDSLQPCVKSGNFSRNFDICAAHARIVCWRKPVPCRL